MCACGYTFESVWQIKCICKCATIYVLLLHRHNAAKSNNCVHIHNRKYAASIERQKIKMDGVVTARRTDKDTRPNNFSLRAIIVVFPLFHSVRYVINKPAEKHVAYQWAKRLWCWSYKMFLLYLFSRWLTSAQGRYCDSNNTFRLCGNENILAASCAVEKRVLPAYHMHRERKSVCFWFIYA